MNRMSGRKSGGVWASRFAVAAMALFLGGKDLRASDNGAGPFEYSNGLRGSVFQPATYAQATVDLTGSTYTNSLTRVLTGGKAGTVLAMTEAAGKNIVLQGPANSWNEFGGSPGDTFVVALSGRFYPPVTGTYTFRWSQDDKGWLFMDTGNDGVFDSGDVVGLWLWNCTATRTLTAGQGYNFIFFSQESAGGDSLAFWYTPPGGNEVYVCPSAQPGQWRYPSRSIPLVSIDNAVMDASAVTDHSATLKGNLYGLGLTLDVLVCWGRTDGGSVVGNWETNAYVGPFNDFSGPVSLAVDGLAANTPYFYTFFATNASITAWATPSQTFVPGEVTIEATDASASETGDAGNFRVTRPAAATNSALTVYYTLGGTAANGADYVSLSGSVTFPVGAAIADIAVTPLADLVWSEGNETVTATLAAGNYVVGAANSATVTIQDAAFSADDFSLRLPIRFAGYNRAEALTNFPALVTIGADLSGFSYSQFLSGANGDLRFVDESMTRELPYEIEKWDATGLSRVWVQVPRLTNNATIWMLWRKSGLTVPAYTTNGTVWSEGFVIVAHHAETFGGASDSTPFKNNGVQSGLMIQDVPGVIAGGDLLDGADDYLTFGTAGRAINTFSFSAWVRATVNHEIDAESNSSTTGIAGQKWVFEAEMGSISDLAGAGLSVGTNGISVYEHSSSYMPPLAVYNGIIGTNWNHITVTYSNRLPRIFLNGQLVRTSGFTSPRIQVNSPFRMGGNNYGYFAGGIDETRVSSVMRSGSWIWAEYMNAASNAVWAAYGASQPPLHAYPDVSNLPATGVSGTAATLNGYLVSTGMAQTAVAVYWGTTDGGTDAGAWANTNWFAAPAEAGAFAKEISGLSAGTTTFFRFAASNVYSMVWASSTETLLTGDVTLQAGDASAAEYPSDTGTITVSRGVAQDAPLTVHYTLSGTAANGVDMSYLTGSVTIPTGAATADIMIAPLYNRNYQTRATDTVTLTLAAGGYVSGSPSEGTVTITNWQPGSTAGYDVPRNFIAASAAPLTGSEMFTKTSAGQMTVGGTVGNTFSGDIVVDTDGGLMRVGAIPGAASGIGVTLPNMTAANTITVKRGGNFQIEDNVNGSVSSAPNRFGTEGSRPAVALNGGTLTLNGANYNAIVPQNLGNLLLGSGYSIINAVRNSGVPELVFTGATQAKGSHVNFTSSSGNAMGSSANAAPHVRFTTPPALLGGGGSIGSTTLSILPGARYGSEFVMHDAVAGIRALASAEYKVPANNDVNTAGATENVKLTSTTPAGFPGLAGDKVINSLNINVNTSASWTPTNKLTLASGQLISGVQNQQMVINYPSVLTAGSGTSDASLDVSVIQQNTYIRSLITDNGSGKVTLTKNGGAQLLLDGSVDNTYSGGTYLNEGTLTTGGTLNRRNLGLGPVRVDSGILNLGQAGATANASGADYTAVNGGQVQVATVPYSGDDTFNIGPGCVIYGSWIYGQGLNSLDRGMGVPATTPNITLGQDAIIAHNFTLTAPLNLTNNTVRNLGTNCDLYYGVVSDQNNANGSITIGTGTAFKGVSTDRSDRRWAVGTINVTPGTEEITLQGMTKPGGNPCNFYFGNWLVAGGPTIMPAGPLTVNLLGSVILEDSEATYGDTTAGKPVTFAVKAGATAQANRTNALGSATGIASIRVEDGGSLQLGMPSALNGNVTVQAGGRLIANNAGGMTGAGVITMSGNSVLELQSTTGLTGPQADAMADAFLPGQLIRLNVGGFGTPLDTLDSHVGYKAPTYVVYGGNNGPANPITSGTTVLTLNRDAGTGRGGMLVNDYAGRTVPGAVDGVLVIGPNGGTIAATSNTTFQIDQRFALGANALTIGATNMLDRVLIPKLGTVYFTAALGLNTASAGSSITVIPGATLMNTGNALPDETDVTVNGTFLMNGSDTIGSLGGSGWVNLQNSSLNVGRNNNSSTFSGTLTNISKTVALIKTGSGRMDITAPQPFYSALFTVNGGTLAFSGNGATVNSALNAFTLYDGGTLLLDNTEVNDPNRLAGYAPHVTFNGGTFRFAGKNGEASGETLGAAILNSGAATIDVVNGSGTGSSSDLRFGGLTPGFGTVKFTASNGTLGAAGDNPRVLFDGQPAGIMAVGMVGTAPAYYDPVTGVRAYTLAEGTEFDGTADQTGVDTKYTTLNNHLALNAARSVSSLWIDSPGTGYSVNLGDSGANSLTLTSGRLSLTGVDDFSITRSGSSTGVLKRDNLGSLFLGVDAGRTLTVSVPVANGAGVVAKDGAGTLVLNAGNTFTGTLSINEGTVRYGAVGTSDLSGNPVSIWNNGVLDFAGDTDTLGTTLIYNGGITNSAAGGALTFGSLTMGGGPAGSSTYVNSGTGTNKLNGTVAYNSANDANTATIAGVLDLNGGTRTFSVNNSIAPSAAVDMDVMATIIGGAGFGITKNGGGVLRLSSSNAFDGAVSIPNDSGTVIAADPQALGKPSVGRTFSVLNNNSLVFDGSKGNITLPALYTNLFLTGAGDYQIGAIRGALVNWSGTNTVASPMISLLGGTYLASLGGKLVISGMITNAQDLTVNGVGDMELSGPILTGYKVLTKNGTGTLTLSGTAMNIYSNTTTVNAGTLLLAKANGSQPLNAIGNGILTINNGAKVQYAASSTNPDMIGTNAINVYATGVLDFNGASDIIGPLNVNSGGALTDTMPIINTAGGGNVTLSNGLFITPAPSCVTLINSGSGLLTLAGSNVVFNTSGNGRARISGNLSLGATNRYFSLNQGLHPEYDLAIDAVISGLPGAGILKDSITYSWGVGTGGILRFEGANTFDGNVTLMDSNKGTLILANNQALGLPSTARTVTVGYSGSLALDGGISISDPSDRIGISLKGTGDNRLATVSVTGAAQSGALFSMGGTNTVPCKITLIDNTQIASAKRMILTGMLTGSAKSLTVAGPGETAFAGANGMITNVSSITLTANATLTLENTASANKADRLINAIPLTLNGGSIRFGHDGGAVNFAETIGAVTIAGGTNTVSASRAAEGRTSTLTLTSLTRTGGTVNFVGDGLGDVDNRNRIVINGLGDGMIGPWATINGSTLAMYSSARGVYAGSGAEIGVAALGGTVASVIPNNENASAVINTMGSEGPITLEALWTNRVLEVRQETVYASTVAMTNDTAAKALQTSRISIGAGKASVTVGETDSVGSLMALSSGGILTLENLNPAATLSVKSAIPNNGGTASSLAKFGAGAVVLSGSNSYAGATMINEGTLEFGGALAQKLAGAISGAGTLVKSGTNQLHLLGANSAFTGPIYVNAGLIRPDQNSAFGSTVSGTYIANGATLDLGCDSAVGGTRTGEALYLNREEFTVGGAGVDGAGAIVNNGNATQMNALNRVYLSDDTTFGGKMRWDLRNDSPFLFFNDHTLTKTGANEVVFIAPINPGKGKMVINQGLIRLESSTYVMGTASNTVTVNSGGKLELYQLYPCAPAWSLILNAGGFFNGAAATGGNGTNNNVWGGPVTLNGTAFLYGTVAGVNWSIPNEVSGVGTLVKNGNSGSTLWLNNTNNTYAGGTIVSNGTLYAKYPGSLPGYNDGRLTFGGDGFLAFHASEGTFGFTPSQILDLYTASTFTTNTSGLSIDTSFSDLSIAHDLAKPMALIKQGTNSLTLAGNTNTYSGITYVSGGTLRFNSTVGTNNMLKLLMGYNTTNASAVIQEGGLSDVGSTLNGTETLVVGSGGTGSYGYYRKNGGTVTTGWLSVPGNNGYNGVFEQYGGDTYVTGSGSWLIMGWINVNNGASAINLFGGTLRNSALGNDISMNHNASRNTFNMINLLGPTAVLDANTSRSLRLSTTGTNVASVVNLNAGAIVASRVYAGMPWTPSIFNFNGGTLRASASSSTFLQGLTAATVYPGGAVFDTAGSDVTVGQPLLAPTGFGLTYVPLRSNGAGYVGAPVVVISGGSGTGATAIASVDVTDVSPTKGTVTGISVTSPGSGYLSGDKLSVALFGGGAVYPAITNDCVLGLNDASGGLTKLGLGALTLAATNTYGGATIISNGVLALAVREALPTGSVVRVDGGVLNMGGFTITNRSLTVTSGGLINGSLVCDSVVKTGSGQWKLGTSLSSATPIVIAEGTLKLQAATPGLYEGTLNGTFDTTTAASLCSNVTVQLSTRMANTNIKQPTGLWGDYATYVYSGYIWNRTGTNTTWTFGESIDDSTLLKIDGITVVNDSNWGVPMSGARMLTPGAHAIEIRFGNGQGGAGLVPNKMWWMSGTFGFGVNFRGDTVTNAPNFFSNFVPFTDPGDGSLLSLTAVSSGATNLIASTTSMILGEGALLDLDGYVQTLKDLSGSGTVSNGTLSITGTIAPGGTNVVGTMTIASNTTLNSGKLLVDVAGATSDRLIVQGSVNLANMTLEIANPEALDRTKVYTILTCSGTRTGQLTPINLPDSRWHVLYRTDGSVQLLFAGGTLIRVR